MEHSTVTSRFREVVARHGARPALLHKDAITYLELQSRAEHFSALVNTVAPAMAPVVGIALHPVSEPIAAMLGVLQSGRAFTFIDFHGSLERKLAVAREMALGLVLGHGEPWKGYSGRWIDGNSKPTPYPVESAASPASACCIVQTSGSTGQPLGVEISHAAMLHAIDNYVAMAQICPEDRFTMLTSGAHFAAQSAIFGALLNGACLCPFDVRKEGFPAMSDWLERSEITIYQSPPSLFRSFFRQVSETRRFPAMRFLRLGGEPVLASDFELFQKFFPASVAFVNTFGITEAAGNVAYMRLDRAVDYPGCVLPVGIPAKDREIFLLDPDGQPADSGQIVVRSDFLATGYYRRPDLNERKFRAASEGKSRELWTGDLGHFTPEGWLMHDGRMDNQVKIRGQRRDLAGLEAIVRSVPGVSDARVLSIDGEDQLVAFVASSAPIKLPPLTIPLRIIYVSDLPLTSGGKVDRAKLIEHRHRSVFSPPRDESERTIAEIWREVLRISDFGVYDDFFALGGDSLRALQACAALEKHYRRKFPPLLFLERPTIAQLGEYVTAATQTSSPWRSFGVGQRAERVVPLRSPGANAQAPLFICPGGWGHENELLVFAALLSNLPADLPVYGLKQNFLRNSAKVAGSVGTMAKNYFREMRRIQSTGPYRLLGECIASVIVLELAHQIRRSREEVQCIILLDPRMPRSQTLENVTEPDAVPKKIRSYYRALAEAKPRACHQRVDVISTEDAETVRRRLEPWNAFDLAQLHPIRVTGNHLTYLREHGAETARAIAQLTSQLSPC